MEKITTAEKAVSRIKSGDTLLVGGFLQAGSPETLVRAVIDSSSADKLVVVSNDTGTAELNMIRLMETGRVVKVMASYIGANPLTGKMMLDEPGSVTLFPQGTLAEKIRAGGAGLAGFYTPVGVGTIVEEGKEKRNIQGSEYLLETSLHGNVALIHATKVDNSGNCFMRGSTKNFGAVMATAADYVIVEAEEIVETGELDPELVTVPGIFIDAIVQAEE